MDQHEEEYRGYIIVQTITEIPPGWHVQTRIGREERGTFIEDFAPIDFSGSGGAVNIGLEQSERAKRLVDEKLGAPVCALCRELSGKPSEVPPHVALVASGVSAFAHPGNSMIKASDNWFCTDCKTWLFQNTSDGDPPKLWRIGCKPSDWPASGAG